MHSPHPNPVDTTKSEPSHVLPEDIIPDSRARITVRGKTHDVQVPYLCIGAWSWGDKATWKYDADRDLPRIRAAWNKLRQVGLTFVDTAPAYGDGDSERICGQLFKDMPRDEFIIQTKWMSWPDPTNVFLQSHGPENKLRSSLERLGVDYVDIYLVHGPSHLSTIASVAQGLANCVDHGLARAVGVANYDKDDMIKMDEELQKHGIPLAVNQCEYSVARRLPEVQGLIRECRKRGIVFQGYAGLAEGRLSGKYSRFNEPPRTYRFSSYPMHMLEPTLNVLHRIAEERRVPVAAVALNFSINKGVLPLVGIRSGDQAEQDMQALGWRLTEDEMRRIEAVSIEGHTSSLWQHG
jgi:aryl-alcohol dehydrogenase-like predicted oxidoreductase